MISKQSRIYIAGHRGLPDGTPRKLMDVSKLKKEGWKATPSLAEGIKLTCDWFLENQESFKELEIE